MESLRVSTSQGTPTFHTKKQCHRVLKFRPLKPRKPWTLKRSQILILALAPFYAAAILGGIVMCTLSKYQKATATAEDCYELTSSMSTMENRFHIDIAAAEHLSFSSAKLIDLSWDIEIGQGARLLHGWMLYHTAARTITWILENSALPYFVLLDVLFYADSTSALWSLLRLIIGHGRPVGAGILTKTSLLAFAIAQVLFFAPIWSAATGYQSPGVVSYAMPDQSWATKDSGDLRICWPLEVQRPELAKVIDGPILGPKYADVFMSFQGLEYQLDDSRFEEDYQNMKAYFLSKSTIRTVLKDALSNITSHDTNAYTLVWNQTSLQYNPYSGIVPGAYYILESNNSNDLPNPSWLPKTIKGWQVPGVHQNETARLHDIFWAEYDSGSKQQFMRAEFELDSSIPYGPASVPYNSTLWYRGVDIPLQAPFLTPQNCTWSQIQHSYDESRLSDCICYKGQLILQDFRVDDHKVCTGGAEYVWGFSRFLTLIGLIHELLWVFICIYLYFSTNRSTINRHDRSAIGTLRNAMDFAEVVKEELGDNICLYTNRQLMEALSQSPQIGYATKERGDGITRLGLVSVMDGGVVKRKIKLNPEKRYG